MGNLFESNPNDSIRVEQKLVTGMNNFASWLNGKFLIDITGNLQNLLVLSHL
jgi:hypothetical protein